LAEIFEGLKAKPPRVKYGCAKVLRHVSEESPATLYPFFHRFVSLCQSENKIMQWTGIIVIGNIAVIDTDSRIE
jgi:hypothetical protein